MNATSGPVPVRTLLFLAAATFSSAASLRACDPILPDLATAFSTTPGDAARVITYFGAAYAVTQFLYGFVGDRYGQLKVVAITTFISGLSSLVCAVAGTLDALVIARIAVGGTAAAIIPLAFSWIGDTVPYERRQPVMAYFLSGQISGLILGQAFAGIIAEHFGWRAVFVVLAGLFLFAGSALTVEMRRHRFVQKLAAGSPIAQVASLLRRPWVLIMLVSVFLEGMFFFGAFTFVGSYIWARFDLGLDLVGLIVAGMGVGGLIYSLTAARLLPRLGEGGFSLWGGVAAAIAFFAIAATPYALLAVPATILAGFGYYMIHNTLQTNATQMAPDMRGLGIATFASCLFLGQALGVAIASPVFDTYGGEPLFLAAGILLLLFGIAFRALLAQRQ